VGAALPALTAPFGDHLRRPGPAGRADHRPGRSTYRPSVSMEEMRRIMADRDLDRLVGHDLRRQARRPGPL